jgi:hypothetical protein
MGGIFARFFAWFFGSPRVPPIEGAFAKESGFVKGQVEVGGATWPFDVTFKIDTGSCWTVLLDKDFVNACKALGWKLYTDPDILNWIRVRPNLFKNIGPAYTGSCPIGS